MQFLLCVQLGAKQSDPSQKACVDELISDGKFTEAEKLLKSQIEDADAPITGEPAIQLEILRRTRQDFPLTSGQVLAEIQKSVPDATESDVEQWRKAGDLQSRMIDGEPRYFTRSVPNLFRFNKDAKRRQMHVDAKKEFNTTALVEKLVKLSESSTDPMVYPVKHHITYELTVHDKNPRVKTGATGSRLAPFSAGVPSAA